MIAAMRERMRVNRLRRVSSIDIYVDVIYIGLFSIDVYVAVGL